MPEQSLVQQRETREMTTSDMLMAAAQSPDVDAAKIRELWAIKREMDSVDAERGFKQAMARAQARMPRISKQGKIVVPGKEGKSGHQTPYALYEDIDTAIRPILTEEGFSESFTAEPTGVGTIWHCIVAHRAGHQERYSTPPLPADATGSKNAVQAVFSANSYAKRYLRCNIWNIITVGVDDDAKATGYLNDAQIKEVCELLNEAGIFPEDKRMRGFLAFAEADSVPHIQKHKYSACVVMLRKAKESK